MTDPAPPAPARRGRAGRNLPAAVAVGVGLVVLVVASLAFYKALFLVVVAAIIIVGVWELVRAFGADGIRMPLPLLVAVTLGMLAAGYYAARPDVSLAVLAGGFLLAAMWRLPGGADGFVRDLAATSLVLVYLPLMASFVPLLLSPPDGVRRVLTFVAVTIASDLGGYFVGILAGRHPMAPSISPKKSWEGFAGSAATCLGVGVVCVIYLLHGVWWVGLVLGAVVVVAATAGDLIESLVKRDLGIKDMSGVLPGHGGVMDRLDSLLATVVVTWVVLTFLLPAA